MKSVDENTELENNLNIKSVNTFDKKTKLVSTHFSRNQSLTDVILQFQHAKISLIGSYGRLS